jgi:hypothetical protein
MKHLADPLATAGLLKTLRRVSGTTCDQSYRSPGRTFALRPRYRTPVVCWVDR